MSNFNSGNNPNAKPPNVLNEFALRLSGDPINGSKRPPSLMVNVKRDGKSGPWCVNFEARTGVENDKDFGKIAFLLDIPTTFMILEMVQGAANAPGTGEAEFDKIEIHNRRFLRQQNAWSKEPMLDGIISVGRTAKGEIFIGVKSWDNDRPICKYVLKPVVDFRRAVKLYKKDGSPWDEGPLSQLFAKAWAKGIGELLAAIYASEFTPPPPKEGGQGGGGYNRGGGQGGQGGGNYGGNRGGQGGGGGYQNNNGGGGNAAGGGGSDGGWGDDIPM